MIRTRYLKSDITKTKMSKSRPVPHSFFARDTREVAQDLLGTVLVRRHSGQPQRLTRGIITETEAYHGWHDRASHAHKGMTKRTEPMFAAPGTIYVYLIYGMYHCLNIATVEEDFPGAVLIRATREVEGPGRLTKHFSVDRELTGKKLGKKTGLWIENRGGKVSEKHIHTSPRVGVDYAGISKKWHWRYILSKK